MEPRQPTTAESQRISELVESSMTTSYRLSPQQIDRITIEEFGEEPLARKADSDRTIVRVLETDEDVDESVIAGYVEATLNESWGELDWLFVDPEHRGQGLGTDLFETASDLLDDAGAEKLRATNLEANAEGQEFFERFGLEPVGDRRVEIGDETLVQNVYADPSADIETGREFQAEAAEDATALPETEAVDGATVTETEDGTRVYLDTEEPESGEEGPSSVRTRTKPPRTGTATTVATVARSTSGWIARIGWSAGSVATPTRNGRARRTTGRICNDSRHRWRRGTLSTSKEG